MSQQADNRGTAREWLWVVFFSALPILYLSGFKDSLGHYTRMAASGALPFGAWVLVVGYGALPFALTACFARFRIRERGHFLRGGIPALVATAFLPAAANPFFLTPWDPWRKSVIAGCLFVGGAMLGISLLGPFLLRRYLDVTQLQRIKDESADWTDAAWRDRQLAEAGAAYRENAEELLQEWRRRSGRTYGFDAWLLAAFFGVYGADALYKQDAREYLRRYNRIMGKDLETEP